MRIPIWPGVRLSLLEKQNPEAVQVKLACYYKPVKVTRVASMRGWMLLFVPYDWRDKGEYVRPDGDTAENEAWHSVWLHGNWRYLTSKMTTPVREHAAACVEQYARVLAEADGEPGRPGPQGLRWWRYEAAL
jgi:hypothetical protein